MSLTVIIIKQLVFRSNKVLTTPTCNYLIQPAHIHRLTCGPSEVTSLISPECIHHSRHGHKTSTIITDDSETLMLSVIYRNTMAGIAVSLSARNSSAVWLMRL